MSTCPACREPNGCRVESGEPYKGPCWCEGLVVPPGALDRFADRLPEGRCLCATCLSRLAENPEISWSELVRRDVVEPS